MSDWLSFIATMVVAILSLIGIIIQTKSKERQENMSKRLDDFKKESNDYDIKLSKKMDDIQMNVTKRYLVTEMTKIMNKIYMPNEEQKKTLKEAKDEYNKAGGDSYVDDMYDDLRKKELI